MVSTKIKLSIIPMTRNEQVELVGRIAEIQAELEALYGFVTRRITDCECDPVTVGDEENKND